MEDLLSVLFFRGTLSRRRVTLIRSAARRTGVPFSFCSTMELRVIKDSDDYFGMKMREDAVMTA